MRRFLFVLAVLLPAPAFAQVVPGDLLGWDIAAPSLTTAQAYRYRLYIDGATTGLVVTATCTTTATAGTFTCSAALPPLTTGTHTLRATAALVRADGSDVQGPMSAVFSFALTPLPAAPGNFRFVPPPPPPGPEGE